MVHCKPLKERLAAATLRSQLGLESYLPWAFKRGPRGQERVPLFPGYIFLHADLQLVKLSSINSTPGVLRLLGFGGYPRALPPATIDALRERLDAINSSGGLPTHHFHPGDVLRIKNGPLQGLEAIFIGPTAPAERVQVLIEFLGRVHEVPLRVRDLEQNHGEAGRRMQRWTRGRGRRINYRAGVEQET